MCVCFVVKKLNKVSSLDLEEATERFGLYIIAAAAAAL